MTQTHTHHRHLPKPKRHKSSTMPIFSSSDSDEPEAVPAKLFGRERPLHSILGGGRVADVLLWRNNRLSGGILAGVTAVWLLFEVVEYNFLTLLCHISITAMLVAFIWSSLASLFDREPPKIPELILSERATRDFAIVVHGKLSRFLDVLYDIAQGKDLKMFLMVIAFLWFVSVVGSCCRSGNLFYFGFVCLQSLLVLYERYEGEVDHIATKGGRDLKKFFRKFDKKVLNKIPRGPVKEKKHK